MRIALTGGIACGKSLFSHFLQKLGVQILDADDLVHQLEAPGGKAVSAIRQAFGVEILDVHGGVDRKKLADLVFNNPAALTKLNSILHPQVREHINAWLRVPSAGLRMVVIPLLFEVDWHDEWDFIICLSSTTELQLQRLMQRRGLSEDEARQRLAAQMPVAQKAARAHLVVENDATRQELEEAARKVYELLMEKKNG